MIQERADVVIVGAGVIGTIIARELSRYKLNTIVVEKEYDVACGSTGANGGVIHAGYDPPPGTLKGKLNVRGNALYDEIVDDLAVPFKRVGALVIALDEEEYWLLQELKRRGDLNAVPGLRIIEDREEILRLEPFLNPQVRATLYAPTGGVIDPFELTVALAENAIHNGVRIYLNNRVEGVEVREGRIKSVKTSQGYIETGFLVNAAGVYADEIARMAGVEEFRISPRKGEQYLVDSCVRHWVKHTVYTLPTPLSKGRSISPTAHENLMTGVSAEHVKDKEDTTTTYEGARFVFQGVKKLLPIFDERYVIHGFAGLRAVISETEDFHIAPAWKVKGLINVAGIQSPGLASAPAIAEMVVEILRDEGLFLIPRNNFNPRRKRNPRFRYLSNREQQELVRKDPSCGEMVCRCEFIPEGEILDALRRCLPVDSLDAIKKRTRAGMGRCQGAFCSPRVMTIIARERKTDLTQIEKGRGGSWIIRNKK